VSGSSSFVRDWTPKRKPHLLAVRSACLRLFSSKRCPSLMARRLLEHGDRSARPWRSLRRRPRDLDETCSTDQNKCNCRDNVELGAARTLPGATPESLPSSKLADAQDDRIDLPFGSISPEQARTSVAGWSCHAACGGSCRGNLGIAQEANEVWRPAKVAAAEKGAKGGRAKASWLGANSPRPPPLPTRLWGAHHSLDECSRPSAPPRAQCSHRQRHPYVVAERTELPSHLCLNAKS
jgi:hypothetical protein